MWSDYPCFNVLSFLKQNIENLTYCMQKSILCKTQLSQFTNTYSNMNAKEVNDWISCVLGPVLLYNQIKVVKKCSWGRLSHCLRLLDLKTWQTCCVTVPVAWKIAFPFSLV